MNAKRMKMDVSIQDSPKLSLDAVDELAVTKIDGKLFLLYKQHPPLIHC